MGTLNQVLLIFGTGLQLGHSCKPHQRLKARLDMDGNLHSSKVCRVSLLPNQKSQRTEDWNSGGSDQKKKENKRN